ncbi:hypothetical protein ACSYT7_05645, partial [Escherichia coli]
MLRFDNERKTNQRRRIMETNIVEVENFVQQSEERRGSAFTQEVKR